MGKAHAGWLGSWPCAWHPFWNYLDIWFLQIHADLCHSLVPQSWRWLGTQAHAHWPSWRTSEKWGLLRVRPHLPLGHRSQRSVTAPLPGWSSSGKGRACSDYTFQNMVCLPHQTNLLFREDPCLSPQIFSKKMALLPSQGNTMCFNSYQFPMSSTHCVSFSFSSSIK